MARPTKDHLRPQFIELLKAGKSMKQALAEVKLARTTILNWMQKDPEFAKTINSLKEKNGLPIGNAYGGKSTPPAGYYGSAEQREAFQNKNLNRQDRALTTMEEAGVNELPAEIIRRYKIRLFNAPEESVPFNKEELQFIQKTQDNYGRQMPRQIASQIDDSRPQRTLDEIAGRLAESLPRVLNLLTERANAGLLPPVLEARFRELKNGLGKPA